MFFNESSINIDISILNEDCRLKNFEDGYRTGISWKEKYEPGGPWVNPDRPDSLEVNKAWKLGWKFGIEDRGM
jgi:hypothetical protein